MANLKYVHLHTYNILIHFVCCKVQQPLWIDIRYFKVQQRNRIATVPLRGSLWRAAAGGEDQWGGRFPLGRVAWDLVVSGNDHFDLKILNFWIILNIHLLKIYKYTLICFHVSIVSYLDSSCCCCLAIMTLDRADFENVGSSFLMFEGHGQREDP